MNKLLLVLLAFFIPALLAAQDTTLVEGFNANFGGWQPGTINGFGVDKAEFYLSGDAQEGMLSLAERVSSTSWGAGFQVIFADTNGLDWSGYDNISYWQKGDIASLKTVVLELFSKEDDEQWQYKATTVLSDTGWQQVLMGINDSNFVEVAGVTGDGAIDWSHITKVNFIFHNNGDFNTVLGQVDNLQLLGRDTLTVEDFNANFGGWQPGTINGFGVDKEEFYLSGDAQEGMLSLAERVSSTSWGAGFQIIFADTNGLDWSQHGYISYWQKGDIASLKTVVLELFSKEDDEQWQYKATTVLSDTGWQQVLMGINDSNFVEVAGVEGDGAIDWAHITKANFIFHNNGDFNTVLGQVDNFQVLPKTGDALEEIEPPVSRTFKLSQNYPNPFNPSTKIEFNLPVRDDVRLEIFNINGQKIITLVDGTLNAGHYTYSWNGKDAANRKVASGLYFYRLTSKKNTQIKRMILLK